MSDATPEVSLDAGAVADRVETRLITELTRRRGFEHREEIDVLLERGRLGLALRHALYANRRGNR